MRHTVYVTTTQLCHFYRKAAIDNMKMSEGVCAPIKLYVKYFQVSHHISLLSIFLSHLKR